MFCSVCAADNSAGTVNCFSCGSPLMAPSATVPEQVLPVGTLLQGGAFVLEGVLGQGGFGITYKCRELKLNRTVALKEFFPQAQGCIRRGSGVHPSGAITVEVYQEERHKFLEEGQRLAQFQHPSIVKVFSLFEENNTAYMVMEFLKGQTLLKMVDDSGPIDERVLVPYIEQVAGALTVVHQASLIHRDIKPENIIVTSDNRAVLVDFGTAREFASGKTRKMTAMLTPGYAPLEQYGQHARFGTFTDIYALGATAYHLLTGCVPIQSTDRAAGVELAPPKRLNGKVSRQVSDAVVWAMEMRVDRRPQVASDFVQAIRGARSASSNGAGGGTPSTPQPGAGAPHPYESRILSLVAQLEAPQAPLQTSQDKRISEISSELSRISASLQVQESDCPCCRGATLQRLDGERSRTCPVCSGAQMRMRKLDQTLCPVCREGHIAAVKLERQMVFCPICRSRSLREEKRKRFGFSVDLWWVCPGCSAEFDVMIGGRAKLVSIKDDPFDVGKTYVGQTLPLAAWQQLAPLSETFWACNHCSAHFYDVEGSRLCLDSLELDPHGVTEKYLGKTYYRTVWAKLANGLSAKDGNTLCQTCNASFDYDSVDKCLKLLDCDRSRFPAAAGQMGQFRSLEYWSLFASGKKSLNPGWLCTGCRSEFDKDERGMKLVSGASKFSPLFGSTRSFEDWHRWSRSLPSQEEEERLRKDLAKLQTDRKQELVRLTKVHQAGRTALEEQLQTLVKQTFVEGLISLSLATQTLILKKDERVLWESLAFKLKQRTSDGIPYWDNDGTGVLVVTDQRIVFRSGSGNLWSKPMSKLLCVTPDFLNEQPLVVVTIDGQQKPVAFALPPTPAKITIGGHDFDIELTSDDLEEVLQGRC